MQLRKNIKKQYYSTILILYKSMFLDNIRTPHIWGEQWLFLEAGIMYDFSFTIYVFLYLLIFLLQFSFNHKSNDTYIHCNEMFKLYRSIE